MPTPKKIKQKLDKPVDAGSADTRKVFNENLRKVAEDKKYPVPGKHDRQSNRG